MQEHGQFDPEIRKQAEEFENSVPESYEKAFGGNERGSDAVQRLLDQARAFDPNVGKLHEAGDEPTDSRQRAAVEMYRRALELDPDKVAQLEAEQQKRREEAA